MKSKKQVIPPIVREMFITPKKERDAYEKWIKEKMDAVITHVLISFVTIETVFRYDNKLKTREDFPTGKVRIFSVKYDKSYRKLYFNAHPFAFILWEENKKKELINALIHEISHIHSWPLTELAGDRYISQRELTAANEELTETIAEYIRRYIKKVDSTIYN